MCQLVAGRHALLAAVTVERHRVLLVVVAVASAVVLLLLLVVGADLVLRETRATKETLGKDLLEVAAVRVLGSTLRRRARAGLGTVQVAAATLAVHDRRGLLTAVVRGRGGRRGVRGARARQATVRGRASVRGTAARVAARRRRRLGARAGARGRLRRHTVGSDTRGRLRGRAGASGLAVVTRVRGAAARRGAARA